MINDGVYITFGILMDIKEADKKLEKIARESGRLEKRKRIRKNHPRLGKFLYGTYDRLK